MESCVIHSKDNTNQFRELFTSKETNDFKSNNLSSRLNKLSVFIYLQQSKKMSTPRSASTNHVHHVEHIELVDEVIHTQPLISMNQNNNYSNGQSPSFRESTLDLSEMNRSTTTNSSSTRNRSIPTTTTTNTSIPTSTTRNPSHSFIHFPSIRTLNNLSSESSVVVPSSSLTHTFRPFESSPSSQPQDHFLNSVLLFNNSPPSSMMEVHTELPTNLYWENFQNLIPNDCLLIIASFLDDSFTLASLPHTCSMWYNYLNYQPLFYSQLYSIKIRELREFYLKDFDLQVQERVCRRRLKAIMDLQQHYQQNRLSLRSGLENNTLTSDPLIFSRNYSQQPQHHHSHELISIQNDTHDLPPTRMTLLEGSLHSSSSSQLVVHSPIMMTSDMTSFNRNEHSNQLRLTTESNALDFHQNLVMSEEEFEVLNTHSSFSENSTASQTSNSSFFDLMDQTQHLIPPSVFRKVRLLNMENVLNNTTTSPIITNSRNSPSINSTEFEMPHDQTLPQSTITTKPQPQPQPLQSLQPQQSQHLRHNPSFQPPQPSSFHIFEKDCYLELLRMEYMVRQHGRDILSKRRMGGGGNSEKSDLPAVPLPEQLLLEALDARLRWHFFLAMPITCVLLTIFLVCVAIKGILMDMGADYESEWNWCLVFLPLYLAFGMVLFYSVMDTRLSLKKYYIIHYKVKEKTKRKQKARTVLKFRKHFFDHLMTSILKVKMTILGLFFSGAFNAFLSLPHTEFGQNGGWYLFLILTCFLILIFIYCFIWLIIRQKRYGSIISVGCACCNLISLAALCLYVILCAALIASNLSIPLSMPWSVAMIPVFLVEVLIVMVIGVVLVVWFKLECQVSHSNFQRLIYVVFHVMVVVGVILLIMHHVSVLKIQENVTFGYATLFLIPIPMIVLPLLAITANYLMKKQEFKYDVM